MLEKAAMTAGVDQMQHCTQGQEMEQGSQETAD